MCSETVNQYCRVSIFTAASRTTGFFHIVVVVVAAAAAAATLHLTAIDGKYVVKIISSSTCINLSEFFRHHGCRSLHLFLGRPTFLLPVEVYSHIVLGMRVTFKSSFVSPYNNNPQQLH